MARHLPNSGRRSACARGRPVIELEIDIRPTRLPDGDPWSNYYASRFAWNDSAATLTRSVLGGAHGVQWERFEAPRILRDRDRDPAHDAVIQRDSPFTARPDRECSTAS